MSKIDSFLKWHHSHSLLCARIVVVVSILLISAIDSIFSFWPRFILFFLWYVVFCVIPLAGCSNYLEYIAEDKGLVEKEVIFRSAVEI